MPSANTKPVAARIPKDHYYLLLREAADRQMTISKFLEDVVIRSFLRPKEVEKKEKGGSIKDYETVEVVRLNFQPISPFVKRYIVVYGSRWFELFPNDKVFAHNIVKQPNGFMQFEDIAIFQGKDGRYYHGVGGVTDIQHRHYPLPIDTTKELLKISWLK
jgi:hypothetical protein